MNSRKKILVIDDDAAIRQAFRLALEGEPYDLKLAASGQEGLDQLEAEGVDLIYLDLRMPGMSGVETLKRIRERDPDVLVYVQTAFHRDFFDELVALRNQGLQFELLSKPLERQQIIHITRGILDGATALE